MAKSPRTGGNRGRRAADPQQVVEQAAPDTLPSTADDRGSVAVSAGAGQDRGAVTPEAIARRAYELFTARGGMHGYDIEDWLQAERELRGGSRSPRTSRTR